MKKTLKKINRDGIDFTLLSLPGTEVFQYEVVQKMGAHIERMMSKYDGSCEKEVYGICHLIEHMCFKDTGKYTTEDIKELLKVYGVYNASTNKERINYYYKGTMESVDEIVKLVTSIALNDLTNVPEDEFRLEQEVVYNEAKLYYDDDHTKFSFDEETVSFGLDIRDNILGSLETIKSFDLVDLVKVKRIMNVKENQAINIVYDSMIMTEDEILQKVERELSAYNLENKEEYCSLYKSNFPSLIEGIETIKTEAEQVLYSFTFSIDHWNKVLVMKTLDFLNNYSKHSLTEEVREKRGLTYHIGTGTIRSGRKDYYSLYCNISKGNEDELMVGIQEALDKTKIELNEENFNKFKAIGQRKRKLSLLDLNRYMTYIWIVNENKELYEKYKSVFSENMELVFDMIDDSYTFETATQILGDISESIENKRGSEVWGKRE